MAGRKANGRHVLGRHSLLHHHSHLRGGLVVCKKGIVIMASKPWVVWKRASPWQSAACLLAFARFHKAPPPLSLLAATWPVRVQHARLAAGL